jgi:hypothetical protein
MGGPSTESYLEVQKGRPARRDALRTRGGVVALAEWRGARRAVTALLGLLHDPPWLLDMRLAPAADAGLELSVTMLWDDAQGRMFLPTSVDEIPA